MSETKPIGIFDSGYGGLTVFKEIKHAMPAYDFVYLGDNARVPYGNRSFDSVLKFTWECVDYLLGSLNCPLVILACNTASAKALRSIQKNQLIDKYPDRRVLGVIRPTTEIIGTLTSSKHVGIFATEGTVKSESYAIEIKRYFPDVSVFQQACPMWVPLVENSEHMSDGADYFIKKYIDSLLSKSSDIDTIILACTHYPLLDEKIRTYLPDHIKLVTQGPIVANSLLDYLKRHQDRNRLISKNGRIKYFTTDQAHIFDSKASIFIEEQIQSNNIQF